MLILSKKSRFGLHGIAYIAAFSRGAPVPFDDIFAYLRNYAGRLILSSGYLAKIFQAISRAGLTVSAPGPRGGYALARPAETIRLIEVVQALDGPLQSGCCLSMGACPLESACGVRVVVGGAERAFCDMLENETVAMLVRKMAFPATVRDTAPSKLTPGPARKPARKPAPKPAKRRVRSA